MTWVRFLLAIVALLPLAGSAPTPRLEARPALWAVRDADTTIYLFGTVHVLPREIDWFNGRVQAAFARSDVLVLELVAPDPEAMARLVVATGFDGARLPPALAAKAEAAGERLGVQLTGMEPWLAASALSLRALERSGYAREHGIEVRLAEAAARAGKPVRGLESAGQQLALFDGLPREAQLRLLDRTIDGLPGTRAMIGNVVDAWRRGDAETLAALMNHDLRAAPELARTLLVERNARWADWIAARMRRPGTIFVAVGAGHLAGESSVQAMLARRGIGVTQLQP